MAYKHDYALAETLFIALTTAADGKSWVEGAIREIHEHPDGCALRGPTAQTALRRGLSILWTFRRVHRDRWYRAIADLLGRYREGVLIKVV